MGQTDVLLKRAQRDCFSCFSIQNERRYQFRSPCGFIEEALNSLQRIANAGEVYSHAAREAIERCLGCKGKPKSAGIAEYLSSVEA